MIGILYICTGRYAIFWEKFYLSAEKFFLPSMKKTYFVFTDARHIFAENKNNVRKIHQGKLDWPFSTLLRYDLFSNITAQLRFYDYLFFFNANIIFLEEVDQAILPSQQNDGLVAVLHPYFWDKPVSSFTYERNSKSTAAIRNGEGKHYFLGGINGGQTDAYLQLIETLKKNIQIDLRQNLIALWHDESHFNHYMVGKNPLVLSPSFGYPEDARIPFKPILCILDKTKYGGHNFLRQI